MRKTISNNEAVGIILLLIGMVFVFTVWYLSFPFFIASSFFLPTYKD